MIDVSNNGQVPHLSWITIVQDLSHFKELLFEDVLINSCLFSSTWSITLTAEESISTTASYDLSKLARKVKHLRLLIGRSRDVKEASLSS